MNTAANQDGPAISFKSHRRTVTETDIVNFVNLVGLHEPFFIDMEYIRDNLNEGHRRRFAPGPMVISLGMGLVATIIKDVIDRTVLGTGAGEFGGMTGLKARLGAALYPNDTIHVEGEARCKPKTSRGYTLLEICHRVINQHGEQVAEFTETVCFLPPKLAT